MYVQASNTITLLNGMIIKYYVCQWVHGPVEDNLYLLIVFRVIKCRFYPLLVLQLQLQISYSVLRINKDLRSSSSHSFHFLHLSFSEIKKMAIYSQNMSNPISFLTYEIVRKHSRISKMIRNFLTTCSDYCIFTITLQHRISKLSKYFRYKFVSLKYHNHLMQCTISGEDK